MKKSVMLAGVSVISLFAANALASSHGGGMQGMKMDEKGGGGMMMEKMEMRDRQMDEQMDQIRGMKAGKERDMMMDRHMMEMKQGMEMMGGMGSGMGRMEEDDDDEMMMRRQNMMEERMNMMEMMMNQMMNHMEASHRHGDGIK